MSMKPVAYIRIHPGIGIARVGNSDCFFVGPEAPNVISDPGGTGGPGPGGGTYRDGQQRLKRQAQRFRVYGYDAGGNVVGEIHASTSGVKSLSWKVHVRNLKAANYAFQGAYLFDPTQLRNPSIQPGLAPIDRTQLIVDPGAQTISSGATGAVVLQDTIFDGIGPGQTLPGALKFAGVDTQPGQDVPVTYSPATVTLGELRLDDQDRLLFVAGPGVSEPVTSPAVVLGNPSASGEYAPNGYDPADPLTNQFSYFNVPGWYDDTCGGSIDVTITMADGTVLSTLDSPGTPSEARNPARGGWVVTAPPKYSPWMYHVVSILDRVFEAYPEADPNQGKKTEFYRDVYPILAQATNYAWVSAEAYGPQGTAHGPGQPGDLLSEQNLPLFDNPGKQGAQARLQIYNIMRHAEDNLPPAPPTTALPKIVAKQPSRGNSMPKLWGTGGKPEQNLQLGNDFPNQYLSLTTWQLARMKDWGNGDFIPGKKPVAGGVPLEKLPVGEQPLAMDMASLQPTIGGGFHPGIEFPYLILYKEYFAEAFRVAAGIEPGSLAAYMSCPWQGDFWSCNTAWWPVQRPDIVVFYENAQRHQQNWFRGYDPATGEELSQTDGYDQMVRVWWQLGMVVPTGSKDQGEPIFKEAERDPALDSK